MLDTYREVVTPEGVPLQLPAAGPVVRAQAYVIDFVIRVGLMILLFIPAFLMGKFGIGILLIIFFAVTWLYPIVLEAVWGQTIGKRVMGLRVVSRDGAPIAWSAAVTRNLLRTVDMLPFNYAVGLVSSLFDAHGRRLGDLVADTLVVHNTPAPRPPPPTVDTVLAPPVPLRPLEQTAVLAFGERAPHLSPQRQQELAAIAAPLAGSPPQIGVVRLYAMANWLLGRG